MKVASTKKSNAKSKGTSLSIPATAPKLVLVAWEDATVVSDGGVWVGTAGREYVPHIFWQSGFLTLDTPEGIHLVDAWHSEIMGNPTQIPRGMIRQILFLT